MAASRRTSRWLLGLACYLAVLSAASWGCRAWVDHHQTHADIWLGPARHVHVHLGTRFKQRYFTTWSESSEPVRVFAPLYVDALYREKPGLFGVLLFDIAIPTWPLPLAAVGVAGFMFVRRVLLHRRAGVRRG